jgi:hypothetical protein
MMIGNPDGAGVWKEEKIWDTVNNRPLNMAKVNLAERAIGYKLLRNECYNLPGFDPHLQVIPAMHQVYFSKC